MSVNTVKLTEAEADAIYEAVDGYLRRSDWTHDRPKQELTKQALRKFRTANVLLLSEDE